MGAIAEMRAERCARVDGNGDLFGIRGRVPDGDPHARCDGTLDELDGAVRFGSEGDEPDSAPGRGLQLFEFGPVAAANMLERMRAAGPVLG